MVNHIPAFMHWCLRRGLNPSVIVTIVRSSERVGECDTFGMSKVITVGLGPVTKLSLLMANDPLDTKLPLTSALDLR